MLELDEIANIALLCFVAGLGIAMFIGILFAYLAICEFFEQLFEDRT